LGATDEDIETWERAGRDDILAWTNYLGDLWISPVTGEEASRCPWLRKVRGQDRYICRIHDVKPEVCMDYPVSRKQVLEDGCPGAKSRDRTSRRRTKAGADTEYYQTDDGERS
jgi:Fe-S-cluster containining protein